MPGGTKVYAYTLDSENGVVVEVLNLGGTIMKVLVDDKDGNPVDVVLGRACFEEYLNNISYFGATIGRNAGRIKDGELKIDDKVFNLSINRDNDCLHGGFVGFDKKVWDVVEEKDSLVMSCFSPNGEEGFPGNLEVTLKYTLTKDNSLRIEYSAKSDADTACNITNHSYFNLSGHESGDIFEQILYMNTDKYIPGGRVEDTAPVDDTPFDFRTEKPFGRDMYADHPEIQRTDGFDHHFVINGDGYRLAARAKSLKTGIGMEVYTNQPIIVLYTANGLDEGMRKGDIEYKPYGAFCLETQAYPTMDKEIAYPNIILRKGEEYSHIVEYKFI